MPDCLCTRYARATEWAALAGARWLGRADEEAAEEAASNGMKAALDQMPIDGQVVIDGAAAARFCVHLSEVLADMRPGFAA